MATRLDIALQRNEDWARTLRITAGGQPIDLTGMTAAMEVRTKLEQSLIASATVEITDPENGEVTAVLTVSRGALSSYGPPIQDATLHYDFRLTDVDGFEVVLFGGLIILSRGETRA